MYYAYILVSHVVSNIVVVFYFSHDCFVFPLTLLSFASDVAIIQIGLIGSNGDNRCLCIIITGVVPNVARSDTPDIT